MALIDFPVIYVNDPLKGRPLFNGQIFVGTPDLDPEVLINQKQLRIVQEDGTKVNVNQPFVLSAGGVPVYNGATVRLDVDGNYSLKILDKNGAKTYYIHNVFEGQPLILEDTEVVLNFPALIDAVDADYLMDGHSLNIKERTTGNGGGAMWDVVLASSVVINGTWIVQSTDNPLLALVLRDALFYDVKAFGAVGDGVTDDTVAIQAAVDTERVINFPEGHFRCTARIETNNKPMMIRGDGMDVTFLDFEGGVNGLYINVGLPVIVDIRDITITTNSPNIGTGIHIDAGPLMTLRNRERKLYNLENILMSGVRVYAAPALAPIYDGGWRIGILCTNTDFLRVRSVYAYGYKDPNAPLNTEEAYWGALSSGFRFVGDGGGSPTNIDIEDLLIRNYLEAAIFIGEMEGITLRKSEAGACRRGFTFDWAGDGGETNPGLFYHDNHSNCAEYNIKTLNVYEAKIHDCEFYRWRFVYWESDGTTPMAIDYTSMDIENGTTMHLHHNSVLGASAHPSGGIGLINAVNIKNISYSNFSDNTFRDTLTNITTEDLSSSNNTYTNNLTNNAANTATFIGGANEDLNFVVSSSGLVTVTSNSSSIIVLSGITDVVSASPSIEANTGDIYKLTGQIDINKGVTQGVSTAQIRKIGGTGGGDFILQPKVSTPTSQDASSSWQSNIVGVYECTSSGSLGFKLSATSLGSDSVVSIGFAFLMIEKIR